MMNSSFNSNIHSIQFKSEFNSKPFQSTIQTQIQFELIDSFMSWDLCVSKHSHSVLVWF